MTRFLLLSFSPLLPRDRFPVFLLSCTHTVEFQVLLQQQVAALRDSRFPLTAAAAVSIFIDLVVFNLLNLEFFFTFFNRLYSPVTKTPVTFLSNSKHRLAKGIKYKKKPQR